MALAQFLQPLNPVNHPIRRCPSPRLQAEQRILIVRTMALGGVVMMAPLLGALRQAYPQAYISWLVYDRHAGAIDAHPDLDEVITWSEELWKDLRNPRPRFWLRNLFGLRRAVESMQLVSELRRRKIDTLISFQPELTPLILSGARPARRSIGFFNSFAFTDRPAETTRYTRAFLPSELPPSTAAQLALALQELQIAGSPEDPARLGYTGKDKRAVERLMSEEKLGGNFIVLSPATTWATKTWSEERWAKLGDALARHAGVTGVVTVGTSRETVILKRIAGRMQMRACDVSGRLNVRELSALIERARLVISSDSAAMHIAAAMGTPYIALFGATAPTKWAPLSGQGEVVAGAVPCGPCHSMVCRNQDAFKNHCMNSITVESVMQRARALLSKDKLARSGSGIGENMLP